MAVGSQFIYNPESSVTLLHCELEYNVDAAVLETGEMAPLVAGK
jgi:hypothetical protein